MTVMMTVSSSSSSSSTASSTAPTSSSTTNSSNCCMKKEAPSVTASAVLFDLPDGVLSTIVEFLCYKDRRLFLSSCRPLWLLQSNIEGETYKELRLRHNKGHDYSGSLLLPGVYNIQTINAVRNLHSLTKLDIGHHASDYFLTLIGGGDISSRNICGCGRSNISLPITAVSSSSSRTFKQLYQHTHCSRISLSNDDDDDDEIDMERNILLPSLRTILMVGSVDISDVGLEFLSRGTKYRAKNLQYIDITFCSRTTYEGTFFLRDRLHNLKVLRRQPKWLDGSFVTPFGSDRGEEEVHTYWADGSFSFTRSSQCAGYVAALCPWNGGSSSSTTTNDDSDDDDDDENNISNPYDNVSHVGDRIQYVDFTPPPTWPPWTRYCYRPGVSLLRLPHTEEEEEDGEEGTNDDDVQMEDATATMDTPTPPTVSTTTTTSLNKTKKTKKKRSLLVAQTMIGIRPPINYPRIQDADLIPIGTSRYFDFHGNPIPHTNDDDNNDNNNNNNTNNDRIMISRMEVRSLPKGGEMPPKELVEKNRQFCNEINQAARDGLFYFGAGAAAAAGGGGGHNNNNNSNAHIDAEQLVLMGEEMLHEALSAP